MAVCRSLLATKVVSYIFATADWIQLDCTSQLSYLPEPIESLAWGNPLETAEMPSYNESSDLFVERHNIN